MGEKKLEPKPNAKYLTLEQASDIYAIPVSTLRKRIDERRLVATKPGRNVLIKIEEMELFMKKSKID
jgi:excisionase family DNA binding protein